MKIYTTELEWELGAKGEYYDSTGRNRKKGKEVTSEDSIQSLKGYATEPPSAGVCTAPLAARSRTARAPRGQGLAVCNHTRVTRGH